MAFVVDDPSVLGSTPNVICYEEPFTLSQLAPFLAELTKEGNVDARA